MLDTPTKKSPIRLSELTEEQIARLKVRMTECTELLGNGCIVTASELRSVTLSSSRKVLTFAQAAWLLKNGELPKYRLRTTCRTSGCCNADHLEDRAPRKPVERTGRRLQPEERCQVMEMYRDQKMRLQDIADRFGISAQSVHKLVHRERLR